MERTALEKILPKKKELYRYDNEETKHLISGANLMRDECLDALVKSNIGVIPSEDDIYMIICNTEIPVGADAWRCLATAVRAFMVEGRRWMGRHFNKKDGKDKTICPSCGRETTKVKYRDGEMDFCTFCAEEC